MAKLDKIAAKASTFSESASDLAGSVRSTFDKIDQLQHTWMIMSSGESPLTPDSFSAPRGSAERNLLDALALRQASADLLAEYGKLLASLGNGDPEEAVKRQNILFEGATERLTAINDAADAEIAAVETAVLDLAEGEKASRPTPHSADVVKLEGVANQTLGALGFVSKVASASTPGSIAGIIVIVSQRVAWRQRMLKGSKVMAQLAPKGQPDVAKLSAVLVDSLEPLTSVTDKLVGSIVDWHNAHRPPLEDPSRLSFEMCLASMLRIGREVKASLSELADSYGKLLSAHEELTQLVTVGSDGKASEHLTKAIAKGEHPA